jgi:hypothetical protein
MTNLGLDSPQRVVVYIDGFNLYHGLKEHSRARACRWLNLHSLAESMLLPGHLLTSVVYFTSIPPWSASKQRRHETYLAALGTVNVEIVRGRFQRDEMLCRASCGQLFKYYVEKQTDVNIATRILHDGVKGYYDWAYLISGDADQAPTIRMLRSLDPSRKVQVIFPPRRPSTELQNLADKCMGELGYKKLSAHLFPDQIEVGTRTIQKPSSW